MGNFTRTGERSVCPDCRQRARKNPKDKIWLDIPDDPEAESAVQEWIHDFVMRDYECQQAIQEAAWRIP